MKKQGYTKAQLAAMRHIASRNPKSDGDKFHTVQIAGETAYLLFNGYHVIALPNVPEGMATSDSTALAQSIAKDYFNDKSHDEANVIFPTVRQLNEFIKLEKAAGRKREDNIHPYPLNNGEVWVNPYFLRDTIKILGNDLYGHTDGWKAPLYVWSSDMDCNNMFGFILPIKIKNYTEEKRADFMQQVEAANAAAALPIEKPDNLGQPTNFRTFKKMIESGVVIELTHNTGTVTTGNSLFNGKPVLNLVLSGEGRFWEFKDGYCVHYWDSRGICRAADDWTYKVRILGPMPEQSPEQRAAEHARRENALAAKKAEEESEEIERRRLEARARPEKIAADAATIAQAVQAFKNGGRIESCIVTTQDESGIEQEENIFVHLARVYGIKLPARSKGFILQKLHVVEPLPSENRMKYVAQVKRCLPDGVRKFLWELFFAISDADIAHLFGNDATPETAQNGTETQEQAGTIKDTTQGENNKATPTDAQNTQATVIHSIRFYYNGLRINGGPLLPCTYVIKDSGSVCILANGQDIRLPADLFPVESAIDTPDIACVPPCHPLYPHALYTSRVASIHAKRKALNFYVRQARITPENAVKISERIRTLKMEIRRLEDINNGTGRTTDNAITAAKRLRQELTNNTS